MKVIVAGATGFIGQALVQALLRRRDGVVILTRNAKRAQAEFGPAVEARVWHPPRVGDWVEAFNGADGVVNLAGEPVAAKRWTAEQKERILTSRVDTTKAIVEAIQGASPRPGVLVNQSAIGYYGSPGDTPVDEHGTAGSDFLASVVSAWEEAARPVERLGVRLVLLRTGIVLGRGGVLSAMALPFRLFGGGTLGYPNQWVSWIHLDDEIGLILYALTSSALRGAVNATAPNPVTMDLFSRQIGAALNRPSWVPFLSIPMKIVLGERSEFSMASQRILPRAALEAGYTFEHTESDEALRSILQKGR